MYIFEKIITKNSENKFKLVIKHFMICKQVNMSNYIYISDNLLLISNILWIFVRYNENINLFDVESMKL